MTTIDCTANITNQTGFTHAKADGNTVAQLLENLFTTHPKLKSYLLEDQGAVRKHITLFLNNTPITDRAKLSDTIPPNSQLFIAQALSGG